MYSHSRKWVSPQVKDKEQHKYINKARAGVCPKSDIWSANYNITEHREAMKKLREKREEQKVVPSPGSTTDDDTPIVHTPIRKPMSSMTYPTPEHYQTNHSTVLSWPTIFVPDSDVRHDASADWPCKEEMDYEGDSRVKTERIHTRKLAAPRVKGNETVAWQHRTFVTPEAMDDFRGMFDEVTVFMREHVIDDCEFTDEQGRQLLGYELMDLLDPVDCL